MDPRVFLPSFHGPRASRLGHKRKEKNSVHNLPYGPRTRLIRGMYRIVLQCVVLYCILVHIYCIPHPIMRFAKIVYCIVLCNSPKAAQKIREKATSIRSIPASLLLQQNQVYSICKIYTRHLHFRRKEGMG